MAKTAGKIIAWVIVILLLVGAAFGYYKFLWVFSDGTKTGELNSLTYTGYIWKTYEGEMILSGYGAKGSVNGSVQSKSRRRAAPAAHRPTGHRPLQGVQGRPALAWL